MIHVIFIAFIIMALSLVYGAFFSDLAKVNYEKKFMPGPSNLRAYTRVFKVFTVFFLLLMVILYILILIED